LHPFFIDIYHTNKDLYRSQNSLKKYSNPPFLFYFPLLIATFFGAQQANTCGCGTSEGCSQAQIHGRISRPAAHTYMIYDFLFLGLASAAGECCLNYHVLPTAPSTTGHSKPNLMVGPELKLRICSSFYRIIRRQPISPRCVSLCQLDCHSFKIE